MYWSKPKTTNMNWPRNKPVTPAITATKILNRVPSVTVFAAAKPASNANANDSNGFPNK